VFLANRVVVMAARPGRIKEIIKIDLPYPRTDEVRLSEEFATYQRAVWKGVYDQPAAQGSDE
ncbi:MAG TPA: ATP-binding protein, partial [Devosia sp.]|nr:ATP-binding protein [Devosia sp.]